MIEKEARDYRGRYIGTPRSQLTQLAKHRAWGCRLPYDLALYDLISPYVLRGDTFGQWHAALSVIYVSEHTVAIDDGGIVIRGIGKYSGNIGRRISTRRR